MMQLEAKVSPMQSFEVSDFFYCDFIFISK